MTESQREVGKPRPFFLKIAYCSRTSSMGNMKKVMKCIALLTYSTYQMFQVPKKIQLTEYQISKLLSFCLYLFLLFFVGFFLSFVFLFLNFVLYFLFTSLIFFYLFILYAKFYIIYQSFLFL